MCRVAAALQPPAHLWRLGSRNSTSAPGLSICSHVSGRRKLKDAAVNSTKPMLEVCCSSARAAAETAAASAAVALISSVRRSKIHLGVSLMRSIATGRWRGDFCEMRCGHSRGARLEACCVVVGKI